MSTGSPRARPTRRDGSTRRRQSRSSCRTRRSGHPRHHRRPAVRSTIDGSVSQTGRGTVTTPTLTTAHGNDLILAFVASDGATSGQTSTSPAAASSGRWCAARTPGRDIRDLEGAGAGDAGGLHGQVHALAGSGYDQMLSVIAFSGSSGVGASAGLGASTGAPSVSLTTTAAGSLGVRRRQRLGPRRRPARPAGQDKRFEWVDTGAGDTFWVQSRSAPTATSGTSVTINDTAPTGDRWNLAAVEVLAGSVGPPPPPPPPPPLDTTNRRRSTSPTPSAGRRSRGSWRSALRRPTPTV